MLAGMRRLHPRGHGSRGVAVDTDGAMLGPDCTLVRRTPTGFRCLAPDEAAAVQKAALGPQCEPDWPFDQARRIADALAMGEVALAQIYGLRIPIADLDDAILHRLAAASRLVKANFDPSQPRVPAGHRDGGQWTDAGGSGDSASQPGAEDAGDDEGWPAEAGDDEFDEDDEFGVDDYEPDSGSEGSSDHSPPPDSGGDDPPRIPSKQPETTQARNRIARRAAEWLARAAAQGLTELTLAYWEILEITAWLAGNLPAILSYQDEPKTLEELHDAVTRLRLGYQQHHIIERQRRSNDRLSNWNRFGDHLDARENLVLIPYWKHVAISAWYARKNKRFGGLTPREYLRGKTLEEQYEFGLDVLRDLGVLK